MPYSFFDSMQTVDTNNYVITLINIDSTNNQQGIQGFFVIEKVDDRNNHCAYVVGCPFGDNPEYKITSLPLDFIRSYIKKLHSYSNTAKLIDCYSWFVTKNCFDVSEIGRQIASQEIDRDQDATRIHNRQLFPEYSYEHARDALEHNFCIHALTGAKIRERNELPSWGIRYLPDFRMENQSIRWNLFSRLIESKQFPMAHVLRSSFWGRIKDTFFVLNGSFIKRNELGVLDYIFPIPRLLTNLLALDRTSLLILFFIPTIITLCIKTALAVTGTLFLTPLLVALDIGIKLYSLITKEPSVPTLTIRKIPSPRYPPSISHTIHESFAEVSTHTLEDPQDIELHSDSYFIWALGPRVIHNYSIRPLAIDSNAHLIELSNDRPLNERNHETLALGLYERNHPKGLIEINNVNKFGIFSMMKKNKFSIDKNLEDAGAMNRALSMVC